LVAPPPRIAAETRLSDLIKNGLFRRYWFLPENNRMLLKLRYPVPRLLRQNGFVSQVGGVIKIVNNTVPQALIVFWRQLEPYTFSVCIAGQHSVVHRYAHAHAGRQKFAYFREAVTNAHFRAGRDANRRASLRPHLNLGRGCR
jgi:hypothetical protein